MTRSVLACGLILLFTGCSWIFPSKKDDKGVVIPPAPDLPAECKIDRNCTDPLKNLSVEDLQELYQLVGKTWLRQKTNAEPPAQILFASTLLFSELKQRHREISSPAIETFQTLFEGFFTAKGERIDAVNFQKLWSDL